MKPSPSKLDLAAACAYPWSSGLRWPRSTTSPAADLGTEVHAALAALGVGRDVGALSDEAAPLFACGAARLETEPPWTHVEVPVALDPVLMSARIRTGRDDWAPGEILGELDLVRVDSESVTVRDWKTGRRARDRRVQDSRQLRWYAVVTSHIWPRRRVRVELAHLSPDSEATIDGYEADEWDLGAWEADLLSIYERTSRASLPVVGPHCRESYCPIVGQCPAVAEHAAAAASQAGADTLREVTDEASARTAALALPAVEAYLETVRESLRAHVATSPVVLDDGRRLALVEQQGARRIELDDAAEAYLADACGGRGVIERSATFAGIRRAVAATSTKRGDIGRRVSEIEARLEEMGAVRHGSPFTKLTWSKP